MRRATRSGTSARFLGTELLIAVATATLFAAMHPAAAQSIEYGKMAPSVLEERLQRAADKNSERERTLVELFENAGCNQEKVAEQKVKGSRTPNVLCTLKGTEDATVIVGAHYDKAENGHGAVDNWSGASLLPSLFQALNSKARRLTFIFIGFTDEEKGLVGSKFYASRLTAEDKAKIRAMVNIDSLGLSDTKVWLRRADPALAGAAFRVARSLNLPLAAVNVDKVGLSDSGPFIDRKIPVIDFHSVTQETIRISHSPQDKLSAVRAQEYENSYALLSAYLASGCHFGRHGYASVRLSVANFDRHSKSGSSRSVIADELIIVIYPREELGCPSNVWGYSPVVVMSLV